MRGTLLKFVVVLLVVAVVPAVAASPASALPQFPAGFTLETEQAGQAVYDLTDFAVLPDGSKWTIGKSGKVAWVSPDGVPRTIAQLPVHAHLDVGLIGVSPAPNYETTGHIYFVYAKPGPNATTPGGNEVARFTANNPADPRSLGGKVVLLSGISQELNHHGAGTVLAAPDGSIYAGFGDSSTFTGASRSSLRAQNIDDPHGKILRVDAAGNGWRTNPFYDPANPRSWRSRVFALGLRNPTRFSLDPRTGHAYIGDVGWGAYEELDVARGGENFGWPCYEGPIMPGGYRDMPECKAAYANGRHDLPLYAYPHVAGGQAAVMGGALYTGTAYPPAYRNKFFFGDYAQRNLRTIGTDLNDKVVSPAAMFATQVAAPVAIRTDTNGDIVYADILSGTIKRLRYAPGNRAPVVELSVTNDPATLSVSVDASGSSDPDGDALTFSTNFGDGSAPVAGARVTHTYANGSVTYPVTVTATDALGAKGTATVHILPSNHVPRLEVTTPPAGKLFAVNEAMTISATATDVEDGAELAKPQFRVVLKHCPGGVECHDHPGEPSVVNPFTTNFPDHGVDTNANVTVSVKDKAGAEVSQSYEARPDVRQVTVVSPVPVKINGFTTTSLSVVAGSSVTVEAPPNWAGRQFSGWSDGGAATHTFTMPPADRTLTASYLTEIDTKYAQPGVAAQLGAPTTPERGFTSGRMLGGRYRQYQRGAILWSPATGARYVKGALYTRYWAEPLRSQLGFPIADEVAIAGGYASYFQRGRAYWSAISGARVLRGAILAKYLAFGGPAWAFPTTDDLMTSDRVGWYSHFTKDKSILWYPGLGAHNVQGAIRGLYARLGWERSCLKYPRTDELRVAVGYQNGFQRGYITYNTGTRGTTYRCT